MKPRALFWLTGGLVLLGTGAAWLGQRSARAELDLRIAAARETWRQQARVRTDTGRLAESLPSQAALASLQEDRAALLRLREELARLKVMGAAAAPPLPTKAAPPKPRLAAERLRDREKIQILEATNAGRATPLDAVETLFWSVGHGDVETLASGMVFDARWREEVQRFWSGLSETTRAEYPSAERLVAALTIRDVPLGAVQVIHDAVVSAADVGFDSGPEHARVVAIVTGPDDRSRRVQLLFRRAEEGWQLVIPGAAVAKYREALAGK